MTHAESAQHTAASATSAGRGLKTDATAGGHALVIDEPLEHGGTAQGPTPFDLLYASLASCVALTCRIYATRKEWPVDEIKVDVLPQRPRGGPMESATVRVSFTGDLDDDQLARLTEIAAKCPVHRTLEARVDVSTERA